VQPKVLVTGANGYTGYHFSRYLAERGVPTRAMYWPADGVPDLGHENLEVVPGDLCDRDSLKKALEGIEVVQNIAALYRPMNVPQKLYWDVNVEGVRNILDLSHEAGVKRFVQCSTIGVHGTTGSTPITETGAFKPDDYYQETKLLGEKLARERGQELGMPIVVVRPAGIYGPRERRFLKLTKMINDRKFIMFGSGEVCYHFIHVEDLCDAFVLCAENEKAVGETYIIGADHALTINQIVATIADELKVPPPRLRIPYWILYTAAAMCEGACKPFNISPPIYRRRANWFNSSRAFDIGKARRELGYDPKFSPEDGLRDMVRSFKEAGWLS
jgi:nucleoside-diphosphate-sugar epimerase